MTHFFLGIGCGKSEHSSLLPFDVINFISQAEQKRKELLPNVRGRILIADIFTPSLESINFRTLYCQKIVRALNIEKQWEIVLQSDIQLSNSTDFPISLSESVLPEAKEYFRTQMIDAGILLKNDGIKFGWVVNEQQLTGGEISFDFEIKRNFPNVEFHYTCAGFRNNGRKEPPYITKFSDERICFPKEPSNISNEVYKISATSHKKFLEQIHQCAMLITGSNDLDDTVRKNNYEDIHYIQNLVRSALHIILEK